MSNIGNGDVAVTKLQDSSSVQEWRVTFTGSLAGINVVQTTVDFSQIQTMSGTMDIEATDTQGTTGSKVQTVTLSNANGGTFRLAYKGETTAPMLHDATAATVESTLEALYAIDQVTVTGSAGGPWTVTFAGAHSGLNVPRMDGDAARLTSGTSIRTIEYVYDAASQITSASDPDSSYAYTYDNLGRVTNVDNNGTPNTPRVELSAMYDAHGNRTSLAAKLAGTDDFKTNYTFDALHRMTRIEQTGQSGGNAVAEKRIDLAYNAVGLFTEIVRYKDTDGGSTNEVATAGYSYDALGRITGLSYKQGGNNLFTAYAWTYDRMNRVTQLSGQDGTSDYTYDATSQLTATDHSFQTDESYSYDANGNRTMTGYTTGTNNRLTNDGTHSYEHDDEGNRTTRTKTSTGEKTEYTWDHRNRLTRVIEKNASGDIVKQTDYTYDVYDRRLSKSIDADGAGSGTATVQRFVYYGHHIVLELDGNNAGDLSHRYLHGPVIDQILADEEVTSLTQAGIMRWPLADNLGTVRDLVDSSASVLNHLKYDAYGKVTSESNAAVDFLFAFTGRERDEETGLQFNRARYYDPAVGRWISEDPIGFAAADGNLLRYINNDPTNDIDPSGLFASSYWQSPTGQALYSFWLELQTQISRNPPELNGCNLPGARVKPSANRDKSARQSPARYQREKSGPRQTELKKCPSPFN